MNTCGSLLVWVWSNCFFIFLLLLFRVDENGKSEWARWFRVLNKSDQFLVPKLGMLLGFIGAGRQRWPKSFSSNISASTIVRGKRYQKVGLVFIYFFSFKGDPFSGDYAKAVIETGNHLAWERCLSTQTQVLQPVKSYQCQGSRLTGTLFPGTTAAVDTVCSLFPHPLCFLSNHLWVCNEVFSV